MFFCTLATVQVRASRSRRYLPSMCACVLVVKGGFTTCASSRTRLVSCWCAAGTIKGAAVAYLAVCTLRSRSCAAYQKLQCCRVTAAAACCAVLGGSCAATYISSCWSVEVGVRHVRCYGPALTCYMLAGQVHVEVLLFVHKSLKGMYITGTDLP
jgi:hypothetical protein